MPNPDVLREKLKRIPSLRVSRTIMLFTMLPGMFFFMILGEIWMKKLEAGIPGSEAIPLPIGAIYVGVISGLLLLACALYIIYFQRARKELLSYVDGNSFEVIAQLPDSEKNSHKLQELLLIKNLEGTQRMRVALKLAGFEDTDIDKNLESLNALFKREAPKPRFPVLHKIIKWSIGLSIVGGILIGLFGLTDLQNPDQIRLGAIGIVFAFVAPMILMFPLIFSSSSRSERTEAMSRQEAFLALSPELQDYLTKHIPPGLLYG
ncbi:MAG: hypothetical protein KDC26_01575 [Armatimonadetes bacterium]|nr:hypothetical protein [Armatimonadota bacterium]